MTDQRARDAYNKIVEGGRRGGSAETEAKRQSSRGNLEKARAAKHMYRQFPILRPKEKE